MRGITARKKPVDKCKFYANIDIYHIKEKVMRKSVRGLIEKFNEANTKDKKVDVAVNLIKNLLSAEENTRQKKRETELIDLVDTMPALPVDTYFDYDLVAKNDEEYEVRIDTKHDNLRCDIRKHRDVIAMCAIAEWTMFSARPECALNLDDVASVIAEWNLWAGIYEKR